MLPSSLKWCLVRSWLTSYVVSSMMTHIVGVLMPLVWHCWNLLVGTIGLSSTQSLDQRIEGNRGQEGYFCTPFCHSFCLSACSSSLFLLLFCVNCTCSLFSPVSLLLSLSPLPSLAWQYFLPPLFPCSISLSILLFPSSVSYCFFFYPVITSDSVQINVRYIFASSVLIGFPLWKTLLLLSSLFSLIFYLFLFLLYLLLFCPPKLAILLIFIFLLCRFVLNIALSCVYMKLKIKKYIFPNRSKRSSGCSVVFASVMLL